MYNGEREIESTAGNNRITKERGRDLQRQTKMERSDRARPSQILLYIGSKLPKQARMKRIYRFFPVSVDLVMWHPKFSFLLLLSL